MLNYESLFGDTDFITDAQKATCELAATVLTPQSNTVRSQDQPSNGVLHAIFNTEALVHALDGETFRLTVLPDGTIDRFERDEHGSFDEFVWEDARWMYLWNDLLAAGLREAGTPCVSMVTDQQEESSSPNWERAGYAASAVQCHLDESQGHNGLAGEGYGDEGGDEFCDAFETLLKDLMHLADRTGTSFDDMLTIARSNYEKERTDDADG
ncbi:hypothetical protein ANMWB30_23760 [Arthrobacter sp. MWB30]|nr:hypothetical protein ANMWB30_23760 [Arthrobacter sp. MWB30]